MTRAGAEATSRRAHRRRRHVRESDAQTIRMSASGARHLEARPRFGQGGATDESISHESYGTLERLRHAAGQPHVYVRHLGHGGRGCSQEAARLLSARHRRSRSSGLAYPGAPASGGMRPLREQCAREDGRTNHSSAGKYPGHLGDRSTERCAFCDSRRTRSASRSSRRMASVATDDARPTLLLLHRLRSMLSVGA